ncbi:TonB-dependent receptor domain-containing protein [Rhodobaculum claviforme]|nr:TonB-dependent receptor [Rhodobaculum claviforme]
MNLMTRQAAMAAGVATAALMASPAPAQEAGFVLPGLTVFGAARDARALLETPNPVSVIDSDTVLRRQPATFAEILGAEPGVTIDGGPRGVSQEINIRGFRDEQVVLRIDGGRQNFNLAHRGRFFVDPAMLRQVEVLRGGASTLFGSGAIGGVVFLETRRAEDFLAPGRTVGGEVRLGFNTQGRESLGSLALAGRFGAVDALVFGTLRPRSRDLRDGAGQPVIDSAIDSRNLMLKLGLEPDPDQRFEFSLSRYDDHGVTPPNTNVQGAPTASVNRDLDHTQLRIGWRWDPADTPLIDADVRIHANRTRVREARISDGRLDRTEFDTLGFEAVNRSDLDLGVPVRLGYGIEVLRDRQRGLRDGVPRPQTPDADQTFTAAFLQAEIDVTPALTVTPGLRWDRFETRPLADGFDDASGTELSPKLALSWRPRADTQLFASVSHSFRAPSLTERYPSGVHFSAPCFTCAPFPILITNEFAPNPGLAPERARQIDLGIRQDRADVRMPGDRLMWSANVYYADVRNYIDQQVVFLTPGSATPPPFPGVPFGAGSGTTATANVDARLWGLEAGLDYDAVRWFAGASLTLPRGRGRAGAGPLGSVPQDRLVLAGGWRPAEGVEMGARATLLAARRARDLPAGGAPTDGAQVLDIFASWQPVSGPLAGGTLVAGIDNLFDAEYRVHPSGLNSPGRTLKVTAAWRF